MWRQLAVVVDEEAAESVADAFIGLGALSATLEDAGDQPLFEPQPGETPLWRRTKVIALFEDGIDHDRIISAVSDGVSGNPADWEVAEVEDRVWERVWLEHFRPMQFGRRLWICPSGFEPPDPAAVNVWLDPGLAFGTGTHPTTRLCLEWLERQDLGGKALLDYGCGSGILGVAALKLGAASAHGVDIDDQALTASDDNAKKNGLSGALALFTPEQMPAVRYDVIVANILAGPLVELAGELAGRVNPGGAVALSGILAEQADDIRAAYQAEIEFDAVERCEEWFLLSGRKRAEPSHVHTLP